MNTLDRLEAHAKQTCVEPNICCFHHDDVIALIAVVKAAKGVMARLQPVADQMGFMAPSAQLMKDKLAEFDALEWGEK